jgi:hypothetical protein
VFDNKITRNNNGSNNVTDTDIFSDMPFEDWTKVHNYFNDFDTYLSSDFTISGTGAVAKASGDGGLLTLTNTGVINAFTAISLTPASFLMRSGYRAWGRFRFQVDNALAEIIAGAINLTATPFTGGQITDGIWLSSTGTTALTVQAMAGSVSQGSTVIVPTLVAGSLFNFSFYYDGAQYVGQYPDYAYGKLIWQVDNVGVNSGGVSAVARGEFKLLSGFPTATLLTPTLAVANSTAASRVMTGDYIDLTTERFNPNATPPF